MGSRRSRAGRAAEESRARERQEILARHCRLSPAGRPLECAPSKAEQKNPEKHWRWQGNDEKVILIDLEHAQDCARELAALYGEPPMRPYECPRTRRGHYHLTSQ